MAHKSGFVIALLDPPLCLFFLVVYHLFNPQSNPQLFGSTSGLEVIGICLAAGSAAGLSLMVRPFPRAGSGATGFGLNVRVPTVPHRSRAPAILDLIAPFLKSSMWESQELLMVMHKSWELMKKHTAFIRTQSWTDRYASKPSNFTMSEAISLILRLLPPVERHSAICSGCK